MLEAARAAIAETRLALIEGNASAPGEKDEFLARMDQILTEWLAPTLRAVINASGVILHTNLGRAPLSRAALRAIIEISAGYNTLEYDLACGAARLALGAC